MEKRAILSTEKAANGIANGGIENELPQDAPPVKRRRLQRGLRPRTNESDNSPPPQASIAQSLSAVEVSLPVCSRQGDSESERKPGRKFPSRNTLLDSHGEATNEDRANKRCRDIQVLRVRPRPAVVIKPGSLTSVFQFEIFERRKCVVGKIVPPQGVTGGRGQSWSVHIVNRNPGEGFSNRECIFNFAATRYQRDQVKSLSPLLAQFLQRWPHSVEGLDGRARNIIIDAASQKLSPSSKRFFPNVRYTERKRDYAIDFTILDPHTNKASKHTEAVAVAQITNEDVPPVPDNCIFIQAWRCDDSLGAPDSTAVPQGVTGKERARHQAAENLLKFIVWKLHGKVMEYVHLRQLVSDYKGMFAGNRRGQFKFLHPHLDLKQYLTGLVTATRGVYGGYPIFKLNAANHCRVIHVVPSKRVSEDLSQPLPDIHIRSLLKLRVIPVLDIIHQTWMDTGNIIEAWTNGSKAADVVNMDIIVGEPPKISCQCTEQESSWQTHPCGSCLHPTICATLQQDSRKGCRVCSFCSERLVKPTPWGAIKESLRQSLRAEGRFKGVQDSVWKSVFHASCKDVQQHLTSENEWTDCFSMLKRATHPELLGQHHLARLPLTLSLDAAFPYADSNGQYWVHCAGNLITIPNYLNELKHIWVPAVIVVLCEYRKSGRSSEDEKLLLDRMYDIHLVGLQSAHLRKSRICRRFDPVELAAIREEWLSGTPRNRNEVSKRRSSRYTARLSELSTATYPLWRPEGFGRVLKVVAEIESRFKGKVPRGEGNVPYPFHPSTMPSNWTWWTCWALLDERVLRMWLMCNRKWAQVDVIETILLECTWQYLDPSYTEFLGLPLSIYIRHPLRFAVAHRVHGRQLRSGWTTPTPSSIKDRDENLNNMLIETVLSNFAKMDWSAEQCDAILADLDNNVVVGERWHKPFTEFTKVPDAGSQDADRCDVALDEDIDEDDFDGEELSNEQLDSFNEDE